LADWAAAGSQPLDVILAMRANKALKAFLAPLAPHVRRLRGVATPGDPIAAAPEAVAAAAREAGIADASAAPSVLAAVRELAEQRPARLLVCGSLYLAGTVLEENA
jgi:dihydrofolate synthase/folylpolyglutamate synthase